MVRCEAVQADRLEMSRRAVAGISLPVIGGIALSQLCHQAVTVDLCYDGGGGDGGDPAVTTHDGLVGDLLSGAKSIAIDEEVLRSGP